MTPREVNQFTTASQAGCAMVKERTQNIPIDLSSKFMKSKRSPVLQEGHRTPWPSSSPPKQELKAQARGVEEGGSSKEVSRQELKAPAHEKDELQGKGEGSRVLSSPKLQGFSLRAFEALTGQLLLLTTGGLS
ncbi:hypothetical protein Taro_032514 [Colocasia esculenta]|uniref:Uncharacterized protein n=1 Tax=Colocasia esculenta TaxID=4460 RepID=A0A843VXI9_COLES|nr:hypothetical protein [Colocasia esculenta]